MAGRRELPYQSVFFQPRNGDCPPSGQVIFSALLSVEYSLIILSFFFFSSRRRHTRCLSDWSSDVCSSDLEGFLRLLVPALPRARPLHPARRGRAQGLAGQIRVLRPAAPAPGLAGPRGQEIGRASCRERVKISVVDWSGKKMRLQRAADEQK